MHRPETTVDSLYHPSFKDMMNEVAAAGTCCACGCCVLVCPHGIIDYVDNRPRQTAKASAPFDSCGISEGVGCDVCASVCPRLWPREQHLHQSVFSNESGYEGIFGFYHHIFVARTRKKDVLERAQDGGVVTTLLAWACENARIDGAVVAMVGEGDKPCFPTPKVVTTVEQIKSSASSWYTYCPNNLALEQVEQQDLRRVAFVGVPCQITPLRKMVAVDPSFLVVKKKKLSVIERQRKSLRAYVDRVAFTIGLFCTEVFRPELMTERVEKQMGIPLDQVAKVNVKGAVLIHSKSGDIAKIPLEEAMREYQRPECRHCGDFSVEMADISCGGVGTDRATIVVLRTQRAVDLWRDFEASGHVEVWPIQEHKIAWNILQRLARRQRERVPTATMRSGTTPDMPQYEAKREADVALAAIIATGRPAQEIEACLNAAYAGAPRPQQVVAYIRGQPIPGDPGDPPPGEKRKLPPPPLPVHGGASPSWRQDLDDQLTIQKGT